MKKTLLTLIMLCIVFLAHAQNVDTMYVYNIDGSVHKFEVEKIERIAFTASIGEAIDLGLSVKWASYNVGATAPEEAGGYYNWGETEEREKYAQTEYKFYDKTEHIFTKYSNDDGKTTLEPEDDVAHVKWGGNWRMPTATELEELRDNCTWEWTTLNGIKGHKVTGPNGNSIFLPVTGKKILDGIADENNGYYWSSSFRGSDNAIAVCLGTGRYSYSVGDGGSYRYQGRVVRPVCE